MTLRRWIISCGAAAIFVPLLIGTAWVAEDAYISFRVSENLFAGYGLRWNIADRVQTYTDPLYLGLVTLAGWITGNLYLASIVVSLLLTVAAIFLVTYGARFAGLTVAILGLGLSKGFIDYSVSGLENPATHLAIAGYLFLYWRKRDPFLLSLVAALAATNREDTLLFLLPSLCLIYFRAGWKVWQPALAGWSPFIAWLLFSLFYYGFLFPNTAYAKLNTGIPAWDLIHRGLLYYSNAWRWDTAILIVIGLGLAITCYARQWALGLGLLLNLLYVVAVGGDYMTSRFLTAAVVMSAALIARYWTFKLPITLAVAGVVLAAGLSIPFPTITSARADFGVPYPEDPGLFIFDERASNYPCSGLLRYRQHLPIWPGHLIRPGYVYWSSCSTPPVPNTPPDLWPDASLARSGYALRGFGKSVGVYSAVGMYGYFAGPLPQIIDDFALGDALLARLPARPSNWGPGHFRRDIPAGYIETVRTGSNQIADPGLHEYYEHLSVIISGDLWSPQRFREIVLLNLGRYDHLLNAYSTAAAARR